MKQEKWESQRITHSWLDAHFSLCCLVSRSPLAWGVALEQVSVSVWVSVGCPLAVSEQRCQCLCGVDVHDVTLSPEEPILREEAEAEVAAVRSCCDVT